MLTLKMVVVAKVGGDAVVLPKAANADEAVLKIRSIHTIMKYSVMYRAISSFHG